MIIDHIAKDKIVDKIKNSIKSNEKIKVHGLDGSLKTAIFSTILEKKPALIITADQKALNEWQDDLKSLLPERTIEIFPEIDFFEVNAEAKLLDLYAKRIEILYKLTKNKNFIILATTNAVINPVIKAEKLAKLRLKIAVDMTIDRDEMINKLVNFGYQRTIDIDSVGKFSVRGEILDIFPSNLSYPVRVEFFDNNIESIRIFDPDTKRSLKVVKSAEILPINFANKESATLIDYLSDNVIIFDDFIKISERIKQIKNEYAQAKLIDFKTLVNFENNTGFFLSILPRSLKEINSSGSINIKSAVIPTFQGNFKIMLTEIKTWINERFKIIFALEKVDKIKNILQENQIFSKNIEFEKKTLKNGFNLPSSKLVVITNNEIFGHSYKKIQPTKRMTINEFFNDINVGDYVVHENHGIGKFIGVVTMEVGGVVRDYIHIQYQGTDKIFLPTDNITSIHKYVAVGDEPPKLSKLNSSEWKRTKARAKAAAEDIAEKLIDVYARRESSEGFAFAVDDAAQAEFEDACEFELTDDQARTLEEVKRDMESSKPMDRLICGDVGFGKTEIAIRAAFKAAMNGKQVAILAPTTVLAYQHFLTFSKRFEHFLPSIDLLSRFRSISEQNETIKRLQAGKLDILIGTHSILNTNRVIFKNLGLLIIDEEQRFGVKQKEKFRDLSSGVDVLSLSATPIPRSLNMSMIGVRDLSVIETPPSDRMPVQTYVVESDDLIISEAIQREIKRKGQIFFVYNRIETIEEMSNYLRNLVPEIKIAIAHGQMEPEMLERIMIDFYEKKNDILLSTTIIENGLDIANANTMIVYNADYFGLSQLYQLRGRVGRSNRLAFAYFLFKKDKIISELAEKRLKAIKDFAQLGNSFNIAMRDLQIRGAGNLLGAQQHGHIEGVGFAVYSRLLQEAISNLKNNKTAKKLPKIDDEINSVIDVNVDAYFDNDMISDTETKLYFYKKLSNLNKISEVEDFAVEIRDRFGRLNQNAKNLINVAKIKIFSKEMKISAISFKDLQLMIQFESKIKLSAINKLNQKFKENLIVNPQMNIINLKVSQQYKEKILSIILEIMRTMR